MEEYYSNCFTLSDNRVFDLKKRFLFTISLYLNENERRNLLNVLNGFSIPQKKYKIRIVYGIFNDVQVFVEGILLLTVHKHVLLDKEYAHLIKFIKKRLNG